MSATLDDLDRRLLDRIQQSVPLVRRPFDELGREFGISGDEALRRVRRFAELGMVRRLGPILNYPAWDMSGALVAAKLDPARVEEARAAVAEVPEITHAYLREHEWNLWFTIIAESEAARDAVAARLVKKLGLRDLRVLPKGRQFKLGVRFEA